MLEAQIEILQAEVEALQRHQQDNQKNITFQFRGQMQDAIASLCGRGGGGGGGEKEEVVSILQEEVEEMEEDLKQQTEINGINLNGCNARTLRSSGSKVLQQFCLSGRCSELNFQVEFKLSEDKEGQKSERSISDLNVVLDSNDLENFSSFVSSVEESCDLLLFFRTLRTFSDRCDDRRRTFQHFQQKYPSIVSLPGGCRSEVMALSHAELSGCVLFVRWSVDVSRQGGVSPNIELLTKIPDQALKLFPSPPVGGAAEAFQSLLRILGVEGAVESIILSLQQEV